MTDSAVQDVLAVNYLLKKPVTCDEAERVLHALGLANYEITKREPEVEAVATAISQPCGRCAGRGTERHQVSRDPKDGYEDWPCPTCRGGKRTVVHASPEHVARMAIEAMRGIKEP